MDKIENTNNLTLAQLIEIWEFCNGAEDCKKCPLNNISCAKTLHTATLEALKNLVKLVDFQKEENFVLEARLEGSQGANEILKAEIARLESDCKTLSAVLSKDVESDKEAVTAFIGFLEENAKIEVYKRPKINLDYEAKFLYIDDIKRLEKEFWEGDEQC
jgi:hypothetical protein